MKRISLAPYAILAFIIFLMLLWIYEGAAQESPKYMLLYQGSNGLNFYCLDELPYTELRPMIWDDELGTVELSERGDLLAQVVQVDDCYLDNVYQDPISDNLYVFKFTSHNTDGHANHRHMTRGVAWIDLILGNS